MKPVITTSEAVIFLQSLRSNITEDSIKMSDLKLELVDIEVDNFTETLYYKTERYIEEAFIGAEYGNAVEIWKFIKAMDFENDGQQVFDLILVERTFI